MKKCEKSVKNRPPLKKAKMSDKWPKSTLCEIRAAWSGTFSIPGGTTGPGFKAEIERGGSRRRILTHFCIFIISKFTILCILVIFQMREIDIFDQIAVLWLIAIRPYCDYIREMMICVWWFSPLLVCR